jgi:uncharacterized membrane protein
MKERLKTAAWGLMTLLSLGIVGYAAITYLQFNSDLYPDFERPELVAHPFGIYTHIFAAIFALSIGPFQFLRPLRRAYPAVHRRMGRVYLSVGILIGGLTALYMALFAHGGLASVLGFCGMAVTWLFTGAMAFIRIRQGRVQAHREWMIRNFATTFAAVTVRLWLFVLLFILKDLDTAYRLDAWLCWVPNLIVAELLIDIPSAQASVRRRHLLNQRGSGSLKSKRFPPA